MIKENNDLFLADGDALGYLAKPVHKKYSTKLFWAIHLVRTYLLTEFLTALPLHAPLHIFDDLPSIPPAAYVLNGCPISQPKNK